MFITSAGISRSDIAAMLSLPLVLADSSRPCKILACDWSSLRKLKGSLERPKSKVLSVGTRGDSSDSKTGFGADIWLDTALLAALALAICSRRAADVFLADSDAGSESAVIPVPAEVTETLEGIVPSPDVAEEPRDADDTFLGVSVVAGLFSVGIDGFLNSPLIDGRLVGLAARVLAPNLDMETSCPCFSGLGVLDRGMAGGGIPPMEARTDFLPIVLSPPS
jgi:hypothetical protein